MKNENKNIDIPEIKLDSIVEANETMEERKVVPDEGSEIEAGNVASHPGGQRPIGSKSEILSLYDKLRLSLRSRMTKLFRTGQKGNLIIKKKSNHKALKIAGIFLGVLVLIVVILGLAIGVPAMTIYAKAKVLNTDYIQIKAAVSKQNITQIKTATTKLQKDLDSFQSSYNLLAWTHVLPGLGGYWNDGSHAIKGGQYALKAAQIGIDTAAPYADIIGFSGDTSKKATSGEQNANDRLTF